MKLLLSNVRLAFANIFEKDSFDRYSATLLIPKEDTAQLTAIDKAIAQAAHEKWGAKTPAKLKSLKAANKLFISDGEAKAEYDGFEGNMAVSAGNKVRPSVVNRDRSPVTQEDGTVYSGCYVNASIEIWVQDNKWGQRINATLRGVQFAAEGDAFTGGGVATEDEFEDLSVNDTATNEAVAEFM